MKERISRRTDLDIAPYYVASAEEPEKRGFYSAGELEKRAWTYHMVRTFLTPDRIRKNVLRRTRKRGKANRYYTTSPLEYEYRCEQVNAVEATPEWHKAKARADRKKVQGSKTRYYPTPPLREL